LSKRTNVRAAVAIIIIALVALAVTLYFVHFDLSSITQAGLPIPAVSIARNWAGNVADNNLLNPKPAVTAVSGSWTVPTVKDIGTDSYSSVWVGIGGQFDQSLIQVGTEQDFVGGAAKYLAWYEMLPSGSITISAIQVSPGDKIQASISQAGTNSWTITLQDMTTGTKFQNTFSYNSGQLSAEWIVERPQINGALVQLANFGSVTFTDCSATISGKTGGITSFAHNQVTMDPEMINNHSARLVSVSAISNGGTQFTVNYIAVNV